MSRKSLSPWERLGLERYFCVWKGSIELREGIAASLPGPVLVLHWEQFGIRCPPQGRGWPGLRSDIVALMCRGPGVCFGWLQAPAFMPCVCVILPLCWNPWVSKKVKGRSFVRKGFLSVGYGHGVPSCGVRASSPGAQEDLWHSAEPEHNRCLGNCATFPITRLSLCGAD